MNLKNTVSVKLTFLPLSNKTALEREFLASLQKLPCLERVLKHQAEEVLSNIQTGTDTTC